MTVFHLDRATVVRSGVPVLRDFSWTVRAGEAWAVVGPTGSGKTTLAEALLGKHALGGGTLTWPLFDRLRAAGHAVEYTSQAVALVTFKEDSRLFSYAGRYYQQRFEFADSASDTPLSLDAFLNVGGADARAAVCARFGLAPILHQPFMTLSNGQARRARLARALLTNPEVLVLDDPFIGLDAAARADLAALLEELVRDGTCVLVICREDAVPAWVTDTLVLGRAGDVSPLFDSEDRRENRGLTPPARQEVVQLTDVTVAHAGHTILDRVSWAVRAGERWAVLGPNGSGKSTLLSLLCGDHPQAFSNDVRLFGRRRGSGETIWDVKRNVGLLSPEFHLYFGEHLTAERAAATGFFDALADRATTPEQDARVRELFAALGIAPLAGRAFRALSTGEQRLVLLARALAKRPPLLILDEPFQGMDARTAARCRDYLDRELTVEQTLLFVTHEPSELPRCVTQTLRLEKGSAS
ncbi:MAG: ATP-binding cassette domain-containing protein [Planctomycetes bacterium]|nr:ATP-binding cassette domain-containing protein [Planctomycetota bacterium]